MNLESADDEAEKKRPKFQVQPESSKDRLARKLADEAR